MLRGDDEYNPRDLEVEPLVFGFELLRGVYRDDGGRPADRQKRPDRPFQFVMPPQVDYRAVNFEVFSRLQNCGSLSIDFSAFSAL